MLPHLITPSSITVVVPSGTKTISSDQPKFDQIREALKNRDDVLVISLLDTAGMIHTYSSGQLAIEHGRITYQGRVIDSSLVRRILKMQEEGFDIDGMMQFLKNLLLNPSSRAVRELYDFIEIGNLPITQDGHFLAYKKVRNDYRDFHTGKFDNKPGNIVKEDRNLVDDDSSKVCSSGLHFCSLAYLSSFNPGSGITVLVKINPADVVAFPKDHGQTKGRCCQYEVLGVHKEDIKTPAYSEPVELDYNFRDELFSFDEVCDELDISAAAARKRIKRGVSVIEAGEYDGERKYIILPKAESSNQPKPSKYLTFDQAKAKLGISTAALKKRIARGHSVKLLTVVVDGEYAIRYQI